MKHVLVLGGGFAGIQAAIELQKSKQFKVTLVSDRDYLYLYPISIWVPVRLKEFDDVKISLDKIQDRHGFDVLKDSVKQIVPNKNKVICEMHTLEFDFLVIAIGASKLAPKGKEHVRSICGIPEQALELRDQLDALIEKGTGKIAIGFGGNPKDKSAVRGGPAFELVFNIHHYLKRKKIRDQYDLTFFAPMPKPGARMGGNSLKMMDKMFRRYKINKHFGKKISGFKNNTVLFEGGESLNADMIMYIAAGSGHIALMDSGLPMNEAGFIKINDFGQVENFKHIYAIGDSAEIKGFDWVAKQGHLAEVMGRNAAHNIISTESGKNNFKGYHDHLNILCLMDTGKGAAYVFRNNKKAYQIPLPIIGHWMKRAWGVYARLNKVSAFPRLPGM